MALAKAEETKPLKGIALVIGQSAYEHLPKLANPGNDARALDRLLSDLGFEVDTIADGDARKLRRALKRFMEDAVEADVALIYYSGHGIEAGGENYLLPIDAQATLDAADDTLVSVGATLRELQSAAKVSIVLLDACRTSPYPPGSRLVTEIAPEGAPIGAIGLAAPKGFKALDDEESESLAEVIGYAAEPGQAALDGAPGGNSPYAAAMLKHLSANQGYDFGQVMTLVTEEVYLATRAQQRPWTNASLRRFLTFGASAEAADGEEVRLRGARRELLLTIAATPRHTRRYVETLAQAEKLPLDPLYGMLKELQVDVSAGPDQIEKQLQAGAENLKKFIAERIAPLRKDPELIRLSVLADRAEAQGSISLAKDYRAQASARADALDETLDQREGEVKADRLELAAAYADYARTAVLAFDYRTAAAQFAKARTQAEGHDATLALHYHLSEADALSEHGLHKGDNAALMRAIAVYDEILMAGPRGIARDTWSRTRHNLGYALMTLGRREAHAQSLSRAVGLFEDLLNENPREQSPRQWALIQSNLGVVLHDLGQREPGTQSLLRALSAHEAALTVRTQDGMPKEWAKSMTNLATTLDALGDREDNPARLKKAAETFEAVLRFYGRERDPDLWAVVQNNLGDTYARLGERGSAQDLLRAAAAFEASLLVTTRERTPLDWAMTQNNLGNVFRALFRQDGTAQNLIRAVAAYELALDVYSKERTPLHWATIQDNLGTVLVDLGQRELGLASLYRAKSAFEAALGARPKAQLPLEWAKTLNNLGWVLGLLGTRRGVRAEVMDGRRAVEAAWEMLKSLGQRQHDEYFAKRLAMFDAALAGMK